MIFSLWALHGHYTDLLKQFYSCFKVLETASLDSVVEEICYHDSYTLKNTKQSLGSCAPKASVMTVDKQGNKWADSFKWLLK